MLFPQITEYEAGISQYEEETGSNGVKLPSLRKNIPDARFQKITCAKNQEIEKHNFTQAQPCGFGIPTKRHDYKQALAEKRKVGGKSRQQDHKPAC